jgi:ribosomal protein S18 acetylase RimI-like enzyme
MNEQSDSTLILPFVIEDYDEVYALWQSCEGVGLSSADSRQSIAAYLLRNPGMSFIMRSVEAVIGAILCGHDGRRGYIHHLAVHENYRRQGLGRRIVKHSLATLQKEGIQKCHMFIFHENQSGVRFWQRCGWTFREDIRVMSSIIDEGNKQA